LRTGNLAAEGPNGVLILAVTLAVGVILVANLIRIDFLAPEEIANKLNEAVSSGMTKTAVIKLALTRFFESDLFKELIKKEDVCSELNLSTKN
jgi:hypothetical protein